MRWWQGPPASARRSRGYQLGGVRSVVPGPEEAPDRVRDADVVRDRSPLGGMADVEGEAAVVGGGGIGVGVVQPDRERGPLDVVGVGEDLVAPAEVLRV